MHLESHRVFRTAIEYGSITKAAQLLHMTQSTASRHLQALEDEYGGLLLERSATGLSLTTLGRTLYPYVCDMLNCHDNAKDALSRLRSEGGGISVGATLTIGEYLLPEILGGVLRMHPQAEIRMRIANTADVLDDLVRHRIDVALIEGLVDSVNDLKVDPWREDELVLLCGREHVFAQRESIQLEDLVGQPILLREEGSGTRQVTEAALEEAGILSSLTIAMELGSTEAIKSAVEQGLGIAFLSKLASTRDFQAGRLKEVSIQDFRISRFLYVVERQERYEKYLVKDLLTLLYQRQV
ncbi:LysR family transcriptional regulator [Alicyclobacillus sp. SO9]|uniref:LysR family transcriptional regulator n=1 Tax=Alicyclobacillus sp. SO9 TaxID=2665646 RepID=UPI0018E7A23A|nr:LysR family transcriptional regulator [Alicyclobacillus sp. SO9]QQE77219.1 LysR family transcriptional regulator [Alicyclobacillus sp. SO9]